MGVDGRVEAIRSMKDAGIWVNSGFFVLRKEVFDTSGPGKNSFMSRSPGSSAKAGSGPNSIKGFGNAWTRLRTSRS